MQGWVQGARSWQGWVQGAGEVQEGKNIYLQQEHIPRLCMPDYSTVHATTDSQTAWDFIMGSHCQTVTDASPSHQQP